MSKENSLKDYLADLYEGISNKKPNVSRNPQDFRAEIESIDTGSAATAEEKTVTPTKDTQTVVASTADFLSKVTVKPIPNEYVIPSGTAEVFKNGTHNVSGKANVKVSVTPKLMEKTVITDGTYLASNDGVEGYSRVIVKTSEGTSNLTGALSLSKAVEIEDTSNPTATSPTIAKMGGEIYILTEA